jgi:hypothetical protein
MMKTILKNLKTTLAGSIAGLPIILQGIQSKDISSIIAGIGILLTGLLAKDHNAE